MKMMEEADETDTGEIGSTTVTRTGGSGRSDDERQTGNSMSAEENATKGPDTTTTTAGREAAAIAVTARGMVLAATALRTLPDMCRAIITTCKTRTTSSFPSRTGS